MFASLPSTSGAQRTKRPKPICEDTCSTSRTSGTLRRRRSMQPTRRSSSSIPKRARELGRPIAIRFGSFLPKGKTTMTTSEAQSVATKQPTIGEIFRTYGPAYREKYAKQMHPEQLQAMSAIETCRTAKAGSTIYRCQQCGGYHHTPQTDKTRLAIRWDWGTFSFAQNHGTPTCEGSSPVPASHSTILKRLSHDHKAIPL